MVDGFDSATRVGAFAGWELVNRNTLSCVAYLFHMLQHNLFSDTTENHITTHIYTGTYLAAISRLPS